MPTLDVFNSDAFSIRTLTAAILKAPHKPGRIGDLGLYSGSGIVSPRVQIEELDGQLTLIQSSQYGDPAPDPLGNNKRKMRSFDAPHLTREAKVYAAEIAGVRAFGSETEIQLVEAVVAQKLATLRAMHEVTLEYHRIRAIQGVVLDANGATLLDLFTAFEVSQQSHDFQLTSATLNVRNECVAALRKIEDELGGSTYTGARAFCSAGWFDAFIAHVKVEESFRYQEGQVLRTDLRRGFTFGGITFEEYRGAVAKPGGGTAAFIPDNQAYLVPEGVMTVNGPLFQTYFAPADFEDTVNTLGQPIYARQSPDPEYPPGQGRYRKLHSQSNPLNLCLRPRAVIKLTKS